MAINRLFLIIFFLGVLFSCKQEPYQQGKNLYTYYCESCHMADGSGLAKLIPPISGAYLSAHRMELPCIVKHGMEGRIMVNGVEYDQQMQGFKHLTDAEISNVVNYVLDKWAPDASPLLPGEVADALGACTEKTK